MRNKVMASRHVQRFIGDTKVRFFLTGIANTAVDFSIYNTLVFLAVLPAWASIVSTGVAMCLSYTLNKTVVFRAGRRFMSAEAVRFFAVTITGQWVLQTVIIYVVVGSLHDVAADWLVNNLAKVLAVIASTIWNYLWYSRFVFKGKS